MSNRKESPESPDTLARKTDFFIIRSAAPGKTEKLLEEILIMKSLPVTTSSSPTLVLSTPLVLLSSLGSEALLMDTSATLECPKNLVGRVIGRGGESWGWAWRGASSALPLPSR